MAGNLNRIGTQVEDATDPLDRLRQPFIAGRLKVNNELGSSSIWSYS